MIETKQAEALESKKKKKINKYIINYRQMDSQKYFPYQFI